jgi:hypothetical protein
MDFLLFQVRMAVIGNYKHDRLFGRGDEYGEAVIASAMRGAQENSQFSIGRYESKSGEHVTFTVDGKSLVLQETT